MLSRWIEDLETADLNVRNLALQELQQLGPEAREAVPALIAALEKAPQGDSYRRAGLVRTLGVIGPGARAAVPLLVSLVDPSGAIGETGAAPAFALLRIGAEPAQQRQAVRSVLLARFFRSSGYEEAAVDEELTQVADRALPFMVELLTDSEESCRYAAARALARYGPPEAQLAPALAAALNDPSLQVRIQVAPTLAACQPGRKSEAIAALLAVLANPELTSDVCAALSQIGGDAVAPLLPLLRQHEGPAQLPSIRALAAIGEPSLPGLRQELRGPSAAGRSGAARGLGLLAGQAQSAFEDLVAVLDDGTGEVRYSAAQALVRIDASRAGAAVPHLVAGLESAEVCVRGEAATMLGLLAQAGHRAEVALPALSKLLTDNAVRLEAALAMVEIDASQAAAAAPVLVEALALERSKLLNASGTPAVEAIRVALGRIGRVALPALGKLLADPAVCLEAALAMVEIDAGQAAAAVPVLMEALQRSKPLEMPAYPASGTFTEALLVALGRIGQPATVAGPLLLQALQSPDESIRASAAVALVRVTPEQTPDAVNTLLSLLSDVDLQDTFWRGIDALAQVGPGAREAVPRLEEWLFEEEKRGLTGLLYPGPGEAAAKVFATLVQIDPTASAWVLARIEADLQSPERFGQAVQLLLDLAREVPASAPLLARLLADPRAEGQRDPILSILEGLGANAEKPRQP
jgi:hypothetical protein